MAAAAWLYYEDKLNQNTIADLLGVSRATVVNYLQEARDQGMVQINVVPALGIPIRLAQDLRQKYRLNDCLLIPDDGGRRDLTERIGEAGARWLSTSVKSGDVLGVAWGKTVLALSQSLRPMSITDLSVVQIAGSMMATYHFSPELCTSNIASRLGGRCVNLHAPALVSSPGIKNVFMQEPALIEQFELIRSCNKIIFGVTNVTPDSMIFGSGLCKPKDTVPYLKHGAVGVLAGRFMNDLGQPIIGHLDECMIGLTLEEIDLIPERICVAGGTEKVEALDAALRGRHVTTLITDEQTAIDLLEFLPT